MPKVQQYSISRKLTLMNMLVSAVALLLASGGFCAYDLYSFRRALVRNVSIQAQIIGDNTVSALLFNDPHSAENTLSPLSGMNLRIRTRRTGPALRSRKNCKKTTRNGKPSTKPRLRPFRLNMPMPKPLHSASRSRLPAPRPISR